MPSHDGHNNRHNPPPDCAACSLARTIAVHANSRLPLLELNHYQTCRRWPRALLHQLLVLVLAVSVSACGATLPKLPTQGKIQGQSLNSTVDSPLARYYLENYLAGQRSSPEWDAKLDQLHAESDHIFRDHARLRTLSEQYSVDTMALFFAHRLLEQPGNQEIQAEFERQLQTMKSAGSDGLLSDAIEQQYRVVFVPGWLYRSKPWTGADFAGPRALLEQTGVEHHFLSLLDNGPIEDNAKLVALGLLPLLQDGKPVILVSGSKGSPEVAVALGELLTTEQSQSIKAWINICGALQGSPLADQWTSWPNSWLTNLIFQSRGWGGLDGLESMRIERSFRRSAALNIPSHILIVNYVGVPVSGTIFEKEFEKRFTYTHLRRHGPNDGLVLLPDEVAVNGITVTEVGRGHFLSEPDFDVRATALLQAVMRRLPTQELQTGSLSDAPP